MSLLEKVGLILAAFVLVLMLLLLWQNLLFSHDVLTGASGVAFKADLIVRGMLEAKLIELTFAILVVFSIAATLFSFIVQRRLDRRFNEMTEKAQTEVVAVAENKVRNSALGVTANIFHELAFQSFEKIDPVVEKAFHGEEIDKSELETAMTNVTLGLHYANNGLDNLSEYIPSERDREVVRRVPGHLKNAFLWLSAAQIILCQRVENRSFYDRHLGYVQDLKQFLLDQHTPLRPRWFQGFESCGFFLLALGKQFGDKNLEMQGLQFLQEAISGGVSAEQLEVPPQDFIDKTRTYYKKAGYKL